MNSDCSDPSSIPGPSDITFVTFAKRRDVAATAIGFVAFLAARRAARKAGARLLSNSGKAERSCRPGLAVSTPTGSGPYFVMITDPCQLTRSTRLRSRGKAARPYICRLIILVRLTLPSTTPELHGMVRPLSTAS